MVSETAYGRPADDLKVAILPLVARLSKSMISAKAVTI